MVPHLQRGKNPHLKTYAKLYEKVIKTSKETLKSYLKTAFATEKRNNSSNVGKNRKYLQSCVKKS